MMLAKVEQHIIDHYAIKPTDVNYIKSSVNDVYLISTHDDKYYFRVSPDLHVFGKNRIVIETKVLDQIADQVSQSDILFTPQPIPRTDGTLVGEIVDENDTLRQCVLLTAVEGEKVELRTIQSPQLDIIGRAMCELHNIMQTIPVDPTHLSLLDQISLSLDSYESTLPRFDSSKHVDLLDWSRDFVEEVSAMNFSQQLIHGDLWHKNILIKDDQVGIIDFDFTQVGPRSYDVGAFLATRKSFDYHLDPPMEQEFIDHYQKHSDQEFGEREVIMMQQLRQLWIMDYWINYSNLSIDTIEQSIITNIAFAKGLSDWY